MRYASIDIETTGLNPDDDRILSLAAVIDGAEYETTPVNHLPYCHYRIKYERVTGDPFALAMNVGLLKLMDTALPAHEVKALFTGFLQSHLGNNERITAAGKNFAGFDRQFLRRFAPEAVKLMHHRSLDPGTLYATPDDQCPPSTEECVKRAGFSTSGMHVALEDARTVVRLIRNKWGGRLD